MGILTNRQTPGVHVPKTVLTYGTFDLFHIGHLDSSSGCAGWGNG